MRFQTAISPRTRTRQRILKTIDRILVTGAFGLVGSEVVKQLHADGRHVVATAHHTVNAALADLCGVELRMVDLTKPAQVNALFAEVSPSTIVNLAAITPPQCYAHRALARAVNVDATATLVRAAAAQPSPPRFVHASSIAVHGVRNPHRISDLLTADTPITPSDLYGGHKAEAEAIVRSAHLEWSVLRLGGVLPVELAGQANLDNFYFDALLPTDSRLHTVDVRDVAQAFCTATTTAAVREVFMIAGDDTHRRLRNEVVRSVAAAIGFSCALPPLRPGNPDSDRDWFPMDWMDTTHAQEVLSFQHHTFADLLAEIRARQRLMRLPLQVLAPLARGFLRRRSPYHGAPGRYADPWGAIRAKWGDPEPDDSTR